MPTSQFKITPTPSAPARVKPGEDVRLSFTVEDLTSPDQSHDVMAQALLVGPDARGSAVDWLAVGPQPVLHMTGGETATVTVTAQPKATSPRGKHEIKLVIADNTRPNEVFAESAPVECEVLEAARDHDPHRPWFRWWMIPAALAVLGVIALIIWLAIPSPPPVAAAAGEPLSGRAPLTVVFADHSTGEVSAVEWSFGDGSPPSSQSAPSHTYQAPGTYAVQLTARDQRDRTSVASLTVKVEAPEPPQAVAAGEPLAGRAPLTVRFRDGSTGAPSAVEWSFGDGSPASTEHDPSHTFTAPGRYTVQLTARNAYGGATTARLGVEVTPSSGPAIAATGDPLSGRTPLIVRFRTVAAEAPNRVEWSFGDGSPTSTARDPSHTFTAAGTYAVTLTAWDRYGTAATTRLSVTALAPIVAGATGSPLSGPTPLVVRFQDRSTGNPSRIEWSFGDGGPISSEKNPVHTYAAAGTYTVRLTARDDRGAADTAQLAVTATVPRPVAQFRPSATAGKWPLDVTFTDASTNAGPGTQWAWRFGDGATSTARSPSHRFTEPGSYTVHLRITNAGGAGDAETVIQVQSRRGELHAQRVGPFGGTWGTWASQFDRCPAPKLAYGFSDKVEANQGGGDDTALNGIKLWCVALPDTQSNSYITSTEGPWGSWSDRLDCRDRKSYIVGARLRIEAPLGSGDDTGGVDVEVSCSNGVKLSNGGPSWGAWRDWKYCPTDTAVCGIRTRVEPSQGGGDDTALNDFELQCCYAK